jgi:hypothetical protein
MDFNAILQRLEQIPALAGKVAVGNPAFMESLSSAPYLWITSIKDYPGESPQTGPVRQRIERRFECLLGSRDVNGMFSILETVRASLVNFQPDAGCDPIEVKSGQMEEGEPGWFLWKDEFGTAFFNDAR